MMKEYKRVDTDLDQTLIRLVELKKQRDKLYDQVKDSTEFKYLIES